MVGAMRRLAHAALAVLALGALAGGCQTTQYYERERLSRRAMQVDADGRLVYIRNKMEAAREGAFGGFGGAAVGSCGCQ